MKQKQPKPKKGSKFTGWATYNWGICLKKVYRTREQARKSVCDPGETWDDVKGHMTVVKVECTVL